MKTKLIGPVMLLVIFLAACSGDPDPKHSAKDWVVSDEVWVGSTTDFETGTFEDGSSLTQQGEQYIIHTTNLRSGRYLTGKSQAEPLKNVMIEVQADQQAGTDDNWFGVMCRVDEKNAGYAFLISNDGFWAIAKADGSRLRFLENWRKNDAINKEGTNTIQAYCMDNYQALYINDEFVGDYEDRSISTAGQVALISGGPEDEPITVAFHDLQAKRAYFKNNPDPATPTQPALELAPINPQPTDTN